MVNLSYRALLLWALLASGLPALHAQDREGEERAEARAEGLAAERLATLPRTFAELGNPHGDAGSPFWVPSGRSPAFYAALGDGLLERLSAPGSAGDEVAWSLLNRNLERFPDLAGVVEAVAVDVVADMRAYPVVGRRVPMTPFASEERDPDEPLHVGDLGHTEPAPFAVLTLACSLRRERGRLTDVVAAAVVDRASPSPSTTRDTPAASRSSSGPYFPRRPTYRTRTTPAG